MLPVCPSIRIATGPVKTPITFPLRSTVRGFVRKSSFISRPCIVPSDVGSGRKCPATPVAINPSPPGLPRRSITMPSAVRNVVNASSMVAESAVIQMLKLRYPIRPVNRGSPPILVISSSLSQHHLDSAANGGRFPIFTSSPGGSSKVMMTSCSSPLESTKRYFGLIPGRPPTNALTACSRASLSSDVRGVPNTLMIGSIESPSDETSFQPVLIPAIAAGLFSAIRVTIASPPRTCTVTPDQPPTAPGEPETEFGMIAK